MRKILEKGDEIIEDMEKDGFLYADSGDGSVGRCMRK